MSILSQYGVPSRPSFRAIIATVSVLPADDADGAEPRTAREGGTHVIAFLASIAVLSLGIIGLAWFVSSPPTGEVVADTPRVPITIDQRAAAQPPVATGGSPSGPKGSSAGGGIAGATDPSQVFYFFGADGPVAFQRSVSVPGATPMFTSLTVEFGSGSGPVPVPGQSGTGTTGGSTSTPGGGSTGGGPVGGGPTPTTEPTSGPTPTNDPPPPATTDPTPPNDPPPSSDPPPPPTTDPTPPPPTTDPTPPNDPPPSSDPPPTTDPTPPSDPGGTPGE